MEIKELTRCLECNSELKIIAKEKIVGDLPPMVNQSQEEFFRCPGCKKLYWKWTHYQRMLAFIQSIKDIDK